MLYKINILKTNIAKELKALDEEFDIEDFINHKSKDITRNYSPFEYVIIDDFFTKQAYNTLCAFFSDVYSRGVVNEDSDERLHLFNRVKYPYDGYVKPIFPYENSISDILFSNKFNLYISSLFKRPTKKTIAPAFHFHPKGDRTGWVHSDYSMMGFSSSMTLPNGIISHTRKNSSCKKDIFEKRAIAVIIFFDNDLNDNDGGGVGLYLNLNDKDPNFIVLPKNNRMFAFSVSPKSYHAFQTNLKDRKSLIFWLHIDNEWCINKFGNKKDTDENEN